MKSFFVVKMENEKLNFPFHCDGEKKKIPISNEAVDTHREEKKFVRIVSCQIKVLFVAKAK